MDEVANDRQLGVFNRGDHAVIGTVEGQELDNPYSMNTVDVCPVGALTSTAFRFKQRVWNLRRTSSVCSGCAKGCNTHVDQRSGVVYRLLPRENDGVNAEWMCDEGRLTYNRANDARLIEALTRRDDVTEPAPTQDALTRVADLLEPLRSAGESLAVAASMHLSCEEAYVLGRFTKDILGAQQISVLGYEDGESDELLRMADKNPNRIGVTKVFEGLGLKVSNQNEFTKKLDGGEAKGAVVIGHEFAAREALAEALGKLEVFVHAAHARTELSSRAHVTLPATSWVQIDGTWISGEGRAQHLSPAFAPEGASKPHHLWMMELSSRLGVAFSFSDERGIRIEMQKELAAFKDADMSALGTQGKVLKVLN
jgi:NADH-quinone oxidoreductase subunit G